ncbi:MAG: radical SAM protein [Clostridia bacterium]|nr:radical SAM protein [Clostridia bacterium]
MKHKTVPIFVPHMGCPNDCSFCNQRKITGNENAMTPEIADEQIQKALKTMPEDADCVEIGFFGGSFTGIDKDLQREFLTVAKKYKDAGKISEIRLSTRPDYINSEILELIKSYGVTTVELGAQSMDDRVLRLNRRGHTETDTKRASEMIKASGIKLGLQMMTGLYGDSDDTCRKSCEKIIALKPDCVRIYPTLVLANTYLDELYKSGEYTPQTLDEAVSLCADLKERFDAEGISVIRIGLMASDNINPDADVTAGPYHPSIGELVQSEIYYRRLVKEIDADAQIFVNSKDISAFTGNKKNNIKRLKNAGFDVQFLQDDSITQGSFKIQRKEQR